MVSAPPWAERAWPMHVTPELLRFLAATTDVAHAGFMLAWGLGMPLLFWHRFPRASRAYMWFSLAFVIVTIASRAWLGECFLTTISRELWSAGGGFRDHVPFTVLFTEWIAGIRPSAREAILLWELAVLTSSMGLLWCWYRTGDFRPSFVRHARSSRKRTSA